MLSSNTHSPYYWPLTEKLFELGGYIRTILDGKSSNHNSQVNLWCSNILSCLQSCSITKMAPEKYMGEIAIARMCNALSFIESNYADNSLTLTKLAEQEHLSPYYLSHLFKLHTNTTFVQCLNYYRTYMAKRELVDTKNNITDIYLRHGFTNSNTFNRVFRKFNDCSPSEFRKKKFGIAAKAFSKVTASKLYENSVGTYINCEEIIQPDVDGYLGTKLGNLNANIEIQHSCNTFEIHADMYSKPAVYEKYYKITTSTGRAHDILKARFREHFELVQGSLRFYDIRFNGIFTMS